MDVRDYLVTQVQKKLEQAKSLNESADTDEQQQLIQNLLSEANELKSQIADIDQKEERRKAIDAMVGPLVPEPEVLTEGATVGERFVKSEGYRNVRDAGFSGEWKTGTLDIPDFFAKATMTEVASGGLLVPQVVQGIRPLPQTRLTVADLMPNNQTDATSIKYFVETTATNAAAATAESGEKQESTLVADDVDEPVRKIATILQVTDEMLDDVSAIRTYIDSRLTYFVRSKEEQQLVSGTGVSPQLAGFLDDSRDLPTGSALSLDADSALDAILMAITKIRVDGEAEPDGIVINPYDYHSLRTTKDTARQYYAGGPFTGAYGNDGIPAGNPGPDIWGFNTVVTPAISQGTVLIGAFQAHSAIFRKGGLTIDATNSHSTNFAFNITAIRAEERLALAVYRKQAFYVISSLSGLIS